jgi:hypothetical protein
MVLSGFGTAPPPSPARLGNPVPESDPRHSISATTTNNWPAKVSQPGGLQRSGLICSECS